ncbi:uroporphyrinogen-III C-methyltransferase [Demetria terragena]|uniref:uroporphyrinogen-III C-methyltransferase n=1 Tax=Demetria terragena TaxID=63959 RepID=UPI00039E6FA3|nr:uroporphyrinogen-III C-methyltransferase [Demetria terragena]
MRDFKASVRVIGRRVLVTFSEPLGVASLDGAALDGAVSAAVLELHAAGARVVVAGEGMPSSVHDLITRGEVESRSAATEHLVQEADLVVSVGDTPDVQRWADAANVTCLHRSVPASGQHDGGTVTLVGGGPGDPGLLTREGERALRQAQVVLFDRLAPVAALRELAPTATLLDVAKVPRGPGTSQERTNELLVEHARAGSRVVRLKGGDPFVFGRGGDEMLACAEAGIPVTVVPGVSSALSVPALAGIPLTHRGVAQGFSVVSGHLPPHHPDCQVDVAALARTGLTIVLLMAVATLPDYCEALMVAGLDPQTPGATIADGSLAGQRVIRAPLRSLAKDVAHSGIGAPAITVIGPVVGLDLSPSTPD